jgi:hypothetical protein
MQRRWPAAVFLGAPAVALLLAPPPPAAAGASPRAVVVRVTPSTGLVDGQTVTISGRGLVHSYQGTTLTWFATECSAAVRRRLNLSTDTPHCDITDAKAVRVAGNGTFATSYRVRTGIIGDGYCGTAGHLTCVIGVGTAQGLGSVVRIRFEGPVAPVPSSRPTTTTTSG